MDNCYILVKIVTHAAVAVAVLWTRFWGEKRWGELLAAAHEEVKGRLPEATYL